MSRSIGAAVHTTLSIRISPVDRAKAEKNAARRGLTLTEYIRQRACGDTLSTRMISVHYIVHELTALLDLVPAAGPARERIETLIEALG